MQDLLTALAFVAIIVVPCLVARKSGSSEMETESL